MKMMGLWPHTFTIYGPGLILLGLVFMLPFQCWRAIKLFNNLPMLMDNLSDIGLDILLYIKLLVMWSQRRFDEYYLL